MKRWKDVPLRPSATTAKLDKKKSFAREVIKLLKSYYPNSKCSLEHKNAYELLVATVLSAQCTDERVNRVTPELFKKFPTPQKMAKANLQDLEELVKSTGFYKNKAKSLKVAAQILVEKYAGEIPKNVDELTHLPGVGVKTANVVLGTGFGITSGIVVDTHVTRLSQRLGLSKSKSAENIRKDLQLIIAKEDWIKFSHLLIDHGRAICKARTPLCHVCFLQEICPKVGVKKI